MKQRYPKTKSKRTPAKRDKFLLALVEAGGNVTEAAKMAGISHSLVYVWRSEDPEFAAQWERAYQTGVEKLEDEAIRRAYRGVEEPVFYKGSATGKVTKYSDTLLIFLLKGAKPEKYAERYRGEISGPHGGPIKVVHDPLVKAVQDDAASLEAGRLFDRLTASTEN